MSDQHELRGLFASYASGEIAEEQLTDLEAALREDAELRREFIQYLNLDSGLAELAALSTVEIAELEGVQPSSAGRKRSHAKGWQPARVLAVCGAMAAMLLGAIALWMAEAFPPSVAMLVSGVDAVLKTRSQQEWGKPELPVGSYTLESGLLHLRFRNGVMVYLEAPVQFDAVSQKRIVLHQGRLSANVPREAIGFTVETPEAEVVDFGTEFSVDVANGQSEVHVFDGLVRVQPRKTQNDTPACIDLRSSEAVRIERASAVGIELAIDRFIRNFDEPGRSYKRSLQDLEPVAFYGMPIRDKGLHCEPEEFSGQVLLGPGRRPPHARGFIGGSLRILAESSGRGGSIPNTPPLDSGQLTLVALVYAEALPTGGTVVTNLPAEAGNFSLALDDAGLLKATVCTEEGELKSCLSSNALPLQAWHHVVMTADGKRLRLFEEGELVAETACSPLQAVGSVPMWFGTDRDGAGLWNGRLDEIALFDRALSPREIAKLIRAVQEQNADSR